MKSTTQAIAIRPHVIPLAAKLAVTAFLAVLVPIYLLSYGPTNFLWFCDAALVLTVAGMWMESSLMISMCAAGILLPQYLWLLDFGTNLLGLHLVGLTSYMFDSRLPLFRRGLSLFHGWLPLLLIWLLRRVGYDKRGLLAWTILSGGLMVGSYLFTPRPSPLLTDPNIPVNVNYVFGLNDHQPQSWINQNLYAVLWFGVLWLAAFLPTHFLLKKVFTTRLSPPIVS